MWLLLDTGASGTWLRVNEIGRLGPNATDLLSSWEEEGSPHLFLHAVTVKRQWGTWQEGGLSREREVPSEPNRADTLISGVQPPEPWGKQIPGCGICVTAQAVDTLGYWALPPISHSDIMFLLEFDYLFTYTGIKLSACLIFMFPSVIILSL